VQGQAYTLAGEQMDKEQATNRNVRLTVTVSPEMLSRTIGQVSKTQQSAQRVDHNEYPREI
jgi:hypothetical protein